MQKVKGKLGKSKKVSAELCNKTRNKSSKEIGRVFRKSSKELDKDYARKVVRIQ